MSLVDTLTDQITENYENWSNNIDFVNTELIGDNNTAYEIVQFNFTRVPSLLNTTTVNSGDYARSLSNDIIESETIGFVNFLRNLEITRIYDTTLDNLVDTMRITFNDLFGSLGFSDMIYWSFNSRNEYRNRNEAPAGDYTRITTNSLEDFVMRGIEDSIFLTRRDNLRKIYPKDPNEDRLVLNITPDPAENLNTRFEGWIRQRLEIRNIDAIARINIQNN